MPDLENPRTPLRHAVQAAARMLPRDAVVIVRAEGARAEFLDYGAMLAHAGVAPVIAGLDRDDRDPAEVLARAAASGRAVFSMIHLDDPGAGAALRAASTIGRPVLANDFFALHALANAAPGLSAAPSSTLPDAVLKTARFVAPSREALRRAGIRYPVAGSTTRGIWITAPRKDIGGDAVAIVPCTPLPGFPPLRAATVQIDYRRVAKRESRVVVSFAILDGGATSQPVARCERTLAADQSASLHVAIPEERTAGAFELRVRREDTDDPREAAAVFFKRIVLEHARAP